MKGELAGDEADASDPRRRLLLCEGWRGGNQDERQDREQSGKAAHHRHSKDGVLERQRVKWGSFVMSG
jgi:hypothetical protein